MAERILVEVRGRYLDSSGLPIEGWITFAPTALRAIDQDDLAILVGTAVSAQINGLGNVSAYLPATDDPNTIPINFTYLVTENFPGGETYHISVPLSAELSGLDLSVISPAVPNIGTSPTEVTRLEFDNLAAQVIPIVVLEAEETTPPVGTPNGAILFRKA